MESAGTILMLLISMRSVGELGSPLIGLGLNRRVTDLAPKHRRL